MDQEKEKVLRELVRRYRPDLLPLLDAPEQVKITEDQATAFLDLVGDELVRIGFGEEWEPNERGVFLESLIDDISRTVGWTKRDEDARSDPPS